MQNIRFKLSIIGIIIFMLPMIINIIPSRPHGHQVSMCEAHGIFPPDNAVDTPVKENRILEFIEQSSRILYAIAICILVSSQKLNYKSIWFFLGLLFLVLYYIVWIRYFAGGRDVALLGKSFLFVPMPLAVFPVLYFLCAALWVHNYIAFGFMVIFGIAHNIISFHSFH